MNTFLVLGELETDPIRYIFLLAKIPSKKMVCADLFMFERKKSFWIFGVGYQLLLMVVCGMVIRDDSLG
jgi:hypothetical protein